MQTDLTEIADGRQHSGTEQAAHLLTACRLTALFSSHSHVSEKPQYAALCNGVQSALFETST